MSCPSNKILVRKRNKEYKEKKLGRRAASLKEGTPAVELPGKVFARSPLTTDAYSSRKGNSYAEKMKNSFF